MLPKDLRKSHTANAKVILKTKRSHWKIENQVHWVLDIAFREDESRVRKDHSSENLAVLRHVALNLLKNEKTAKGGISCQAITSWLEQRLFAHHPQKLKCVYPELCAPFGNLSVWLRYNRAVRRSAYSGRPQILEVI